MLLSTSALTLPQPAIAQGQAGIDVPAQAAPDAITQLARQTGTQIMFDHDRLKHIRSRAVHGAKSPRQALQEMFDGSNLEIGDTPSGALVIKERLRTAPVNDPVATDPNDNAEIIVTAQKRIERQIDTPQSVSVLGPATLEKLNATQFRDFANTIPGLTFSTSGAGYNQLSLRGVTTGFDLTPTVGIYVDDVPYGSSNGFAQGAQLGLDIGLFDLDRIEVLRGPQGTLYGASTMGGLLKYVTKKPDTTKFDGTAQAGVATTHDGGTSYNGALALNLPVVTDKLAVRVSGFYNHDGGYIDNILRDVKDINRSRTYGGRADILFTPTDNFSFRVAGFLQNIDRDGPSTADYTSAGVPVAGGLDQERAVAEPFHQRFRLVSGTADWNVGFADITSITSYQNAKTHAVFDFRNFLPILARFYSLNYGALAFPENVDTKKFTQEVRLSSARKGRLDWLIGAFYTHENSTNVQAFLPYNFDGSPGPANLYSYSGPTKFQEIAGFGNLTFHVTDRFDVSGGVRYAHNDQSFTQFGSGLLIGSAPRQDSSEGVFTYLANAKYKITDRISAYLRYATGYRPGGPNYIANDPTTGKPVAPPTFQSDHLKSYEAGLKGETDDGTFGFDLSGYHIDWSNIQINAVRGGFGVIANSAAGATINGAEVSLTARPTRGLNVVGAFAYQAAELAHDDPDLGGHKGEQLPNVPKFTVALTADYALLDAALKPSIGGTLRFVSDRYASFDLSSTPQYHVPDYVSVDLRAGFEAHRVRVQVYARNIFDERGALSVQTNRGDPEVSLIQPRTIGISATTDF